MVSSNLAFSELYNSMAAYSAAEASQKSASNLALKFSNKDLTLFNNSSLASTSLLDNYTKADNTPDIQWAFLFLTASFNNLLQCLVNYKKEASPLQISSKMSKASSMA